MQKLITQDHAAWERDQLRRVGAGLRAAAHGASELTKSRKSERLGNAILADLLRLEAQIKVRSMRPGKPGAKTHEEEEEVERHGNR